jgi:hypothetical protein
VQPLRERIEAFQTRAYDRVVRDDVAYTDTLALTTAEINRLLELYRAGGRRQHQRLLRDAIDHWLRRYHGYTIGGSIGTHYRSLEIPSMDTVFEHVIPAKDLRDMLIAGALTMAEALNAPVCRITKDQDRRLKASGLGSSTPDRWHFFRRYSVLETEFYRVNDGAAIDISSYSLIDHYQHYIR